MLRIPRITISKYACTERQYTIRYDTIGSIDITRYEIVFVRNDVSSDSSGYDGSCQYHMKGDGMTRSLPYCCKTLTLRVGGTMLSGAGRSACFVLIS